MITHPFNKFEYIVEDEFQLDRWPSLKVIPKRPIPLSDSFFHYYRLSNDNKDALLNNFIYANHPFEFNDPFDCNRELISFEKATFEEVLALNRNPSKPEFLQQLFYSKKKKDRTLLYDMLKYLVYNVIYMKTGIFCMSSKIDSLEMWSYYTNHRGFALEFDMQKLPTNYWGPFPINYTNNFKAIDYSIFKGLSFLYQSNIKAKCWEHENEWRIILYGPNMMKIPFKKYPDAHDRKFAYNQNAIKQIVLGFQFFEIFEYIPNTEISDTYVIRLRKNKSLKRQILKYIISNEIPTSIISLKRKSSSKLKPRPVRMKILSPDKYQIKYVG